MCAFQTQIVAHRDCRLREPGLYQRNADSQSWPESKNGASGKWQWPGAMFRVLPSATRQMTKARRR